MDSKTKKVAVVMPFYKETLSAYEKIAISQCQNVLGAYPIIAIKPQSLALPVGIPPGMLLETIDFDDKYFKDIAGYNALMLSADFYKTFLEYEYILVYQLDAFVFKDDLPYWCSQGYDYIGAPWLREHAYPDAIKALKSKAQYYLHTRYNIKKNGVPTFLQFENKVGNGGFSLRRIKPFYDLCIKMRAEIDSYLSHTAHEYNEDMFWSIEVNRKKKILNIPSYKTGLKFSIENFPNRALELNNDQLPFGCHAWDKNPDFWRPIFEKYGYTI
jgi:hypothetical protein